jgi:hypothetical protein
MPDYYLDLDGFVTYNYKYKCLSPYIRLDEASFLCIGAPGRLIVHSYG